MSASSLPLPVRPLRTALLGTRAFVLLLTTTVVGAIAASAPYTGFTWPPSASTLVALGRVVGLMLVVAGASALARSHYALRRSLAERVRAEAEARTAALTDELTGVYNRRGFRALADHQLRIARRSGTDALLLFVDLDGFKGINDRHGHAAGDAALHEVGELLRNTVRDTDIVARLGGDEFVVLVVDPDSATERAVRSRLTCALAMRNARATRGYPLAFSVGAASLDANPAATLDELIDAADHELYVAKKRRAALVS